MHEELYPYYERELEYLRKSTVEFARHHPKAAGALRIEKDSEQDPHVERLLEGCAFLTARIRRKLDDEFPEISESLLQLLCPQLTLPVPAVGIAQFQVDPQAAKLTSAYRIPKKTMLNSVPVHGVPCTFSTCYPVDLAPLDIDEVKLDDWLRDTGPEKKCSWQSKSVLTLSFKSLCGLSFADFSLPRLRLYLRGGTPLADRLYDLLGRNVVRIEVAAGGILNAREIENENARGFFLSPEAIQPVGFGDDEELLPYPNNAFAGYRLLREFFVFPEKFFFYDIDLAGIIASLGNIRTFSLRFYLEGKPDFSVSADQFALGCTPIVNLFKKKAEPRNTKPDRYEYNVVPDIGKPECYEVYTVDNITTTDLATGENIDVEPFFTFRHALEPTTPFYWYARREPVPDESPHRKEINKADEVYIELCSLDYASPESATIENRSLGMTITCSNRNLVREMPVHEDGKTDFEAVNLPIFGPIAAMKLQSDVIRTPLGHNDEYWTASSSSTKIWRGGYWRLISHLSLNYLSLKTGGIKALQALLQLYDFRGEPENENIIFGLTDLSVHPVNRLIKGVLCRGIGIELSINVNQFKESSFYLLASVLDRFFALYVSINSFTQLTVVDNTQGKKRLKQWPIRTGEQKAI